MLFSFFGVCNQNMYKSVHSLECEPAVWVRGGPCRSACWCPAAPSCPGWCRAAASSTPLAHSSVKCAGHTVSIRLTFSERQPGRLGVCASAVPAAGDEPPRPAVRDEGERLPPACRLHTLALQWSGKIFIKQPKGDSTTTGVAQLKQAFQVLLY